MTLAIRWTHEGGENRRCWPHEPGDWQKDAAPSIGVPIAGLSATPELAIRNDMYRV